MTKVKICGITNLEDALVAVEAGADLLGFIFYEPSPRYISPDLAREIVAGVREQVAGYRSPVTGDKSQVAGGSDNTVASELKTQNPELKTPTFVGVFVNASLATVAHILDECQLDAAQLHGDEPPEFVNQLQGRAYKAIRPQSLPEADSLIQHYLPCSSAPLLPCYLLDAYHPNLFGGTGHVTDWSMAAALARRYPLMLAGSLTPANVAEAIAIVRPWGVDVGSGVERAKGQKDHQKVREFVAAVKNLASKT
jgi:phosphoribosylanthranilate isomerase